VFKIKQKYNFIDSPLKDYIHHAMLNDDDDRDLNEALAERNNLTRLFLDDVKFRMCRKKNYVISFFGDTGIGKSTIAQYIAKYTHDFVLSDYCKNSKGEKIVDLIEEKYGDKPKFDETNIVFDAAEFNSRLKDSLPMETFIYDEHSDKPVGTGSNREKMDKERIIKRVRALQQNFIFCDPLIDESKVGQLHLYKLNAWDIDYEQQLNRTLIQAKNSYEQYVYFGHMITKQYEHENYDKKKMKQITDLENFEQGGGRIAQWDKVAEEMLEKGISDYPKGDWHYFIEEWTKQQYTKDEVKAIKNKVGYKVAEKKQKEKDK